MEILIIANSRYKGGASGGDKIYENFVKHWPCKFEVQTLEHLDYKPFTICYLHRIFEGIRVAIADDSKFDFVYSSSDFLPDVLPAMIYKLKGNKWIAGFFLKAFIQNKIHYWTQKLVTRWIKKHATAVILTNPTMYPVFEYKPKTWINGGIETEFACVKNTPKEYDAVFCGRIHESKGINLLINMWYFVRQQSPKAKLAIIGDGDLGIKYVEKLIKSAFGRHVDSGIRLLGYMGAERYKVYQRSKVVLYPTPQTFDHFSMAPVEAMACGCPLVAFNTNTTSYYYNKLKMKNCYLANNPETFIEAILHLIGGDWKDNVLETAEWASQFDYKKQSLRVLNDIREILVNEDSSNRSQRNGGDSPTFRYV